MSDMIKNYSTTIAAERTAAEVQTMLGVAGADQVMVTYTGARGARRPAGVRFSLDTPMGIQAFVLPVNIDGVARVLAKVRQVPGGMSRAKLTSTEHAERVAWRIARDWLDAQIAIVEAGMASVDEVFLPYMVTGGSVTSPQTLYARMLEQGLPALESGRG